MRHFQTANAAALLCERKAKIGMQNSANGVRFAPIRFSMDVLSEYQVRCPQCGEPFGMTIDTSQGSYTTIEDCAICCRPIALEIECAPGEVREVRVSAA